MANRIAVVAVHGMGTFTPPEPGKKKSQYSAPLAGLVCSALGKKAYDASVFWHETYYGDILGRNQAALMKRLGPIATSAAMRDFVVENLGDPASYATRWDDENNTVYRAVHDALNRTIAAARKAAGADAPVVLLPHSLGAKVVSNHIWDGQKGRLPGTYVKPDCIARLITFGCNLPLFSFAFEYKDIRAISDPSTGLAGKFRSKPWWINCYDRDDPLGFPLVPGGKGFADLASAAELSDREVAAAGWITGSTPMSHTGYWTSQDFARIVARELKALIGA